MTILELSQGMLDLLSMTPVKDMSRAYSGETRDHLSVSRSSCTGSVSGLSVANPER